MFRWRLGMSAGGAGFRPSHVRWSVFRRRRGTSPSPTLGRWSLFRRRCRVPALPRPVVGVSPAAGMRAGHTGGGVAAGRLGMSAGGAGFRPSQVRWSVFRRRRGTSPSPTLGRWSLFRWRLGMSAGGAGVPALPGTVVGVSPAAGDKPQPYIRTVVIVSPAVQGSGPPTSGGRCFAGGGGQAPALH